MLTLEEQIERVADIATAEAAERSRAHDHGMRRRRVSGAHSLVSVAAAVLVVGLVGGLVWIVLGRSEPPAVTNPPALPQRQSGPTLPLNEPTLDADPDRSTETTMPTSTHAEGDEGRAASAPDEGVHSLEPLLPYELFQYSPEDEHNLIKTYYARLNRCLVDAGDDPIDPAIDSAALIRSERLALRQLRTDPSSDVSIPERAMLGVTDGTAEQRRCSDAAYDSLRTASGRAFDEDPIEAVEAAVEISARVANGLEPHQADWSNCMRDAGFPDARMSSWTNAAPAWTAADEHCRATSGYNERKMELLASNTEQWAIENAELIEVLLSEMDLVVQQAGTLP